MDDALAKAPTPLGTREAIATALSLLTPRDRRRYRLVAAAQMTTSLLDLVGVLLLGAVGIFAAAAIQDTGLPPSIAPRIESLGLGQMSVVALAGLCAAAAAVFLLTKSVLTAVLMRRVFRFLGDRQGEVSSRLSERLLGQPLLALERRSSQESVYAISTGAYILITAMLGSFALLLSELALLIVLFAALFFIDPVVTIAAAVYFAAVGFGIHRGLSTWAKRVGTTISQTTVLGQQRLQEALAAYREITVLGRRAHYSQTIAEQFRHSGKASGDSLFLMQLPKIAYETALVVGGVALVGWQFAVAGPVEAVATVVLFVAAGSRVLPSMLRINTLVLSIRMGTGNAALLFPIIRELEAAPAPAGDEQPVSGRPWEAADAFADFHPVIEMRRVSVTYPGSESPALRDVTLSIAAGARVAIVGPTGAGKSTLADVLLGVLEPEAGEVTISGLPAKLVIARWPGVIGYVPQGVAMINGTVRENVALGLDPTQTDDARVWAALENAQLAAFLIEQRDGIDTVIGERGVRLSGGQRQRLGLARALYTSPRLLVLDEATSALDVETESLVAVALGALSRDVTTVTIAHRLATIRDADVVVYLDSGAVRDLGTFEEVRGRNPAFERQALLSGIS